jgi:ornithine cyclodeaminase
MLIIESQVIERTLVFKEVIDLMRDALVAQANGECDTPMPMHLNIQPETAEVHFKSSYRQGGSVFALKMATTFPRNRERGLSSGNGLTLLASAETGAPLAVLADGGRLTDVRTAAVAALVAHQLGRQDRSMGILGTGIQACLQAQMHAEVLPLQEIVIWGRNPQRVAACRSRLAAVLPGLAVTAANQPADVAAKTRLIVTCTASKTPLLIAKDIQPGTHISAVGSDTLGKQELDPAILESASLLLVDSLLQCVRLGELQHATACGEHAVEIGAFCLSPCRIRQTDVTVCDFTGLGVEDLFIAEYCYRKIMRY